MNNRELEALFTTESRRHLVDRRIVEVRYLTPEEARDLYWDERCIVIVLDDGTMLFPSRDPEGNGAGALFGQTIGGLNLTIPAIRR